MGNKTMINNIIKTREFKIEVTGGGAFPIDMLRYDQCSPYSETDSHMIEDSIREMTGRRTITLIGRNSKGEPTPGRWDSFNWKVRVIS
jgi:hypothetical protein